MIARFFAWLRRHLLGEVLTELQAIHEELRAARTGDHTRVIAPRPAARAPRQFHFEARQ